MNKESTLRPLSRSEIILDSELGARPVKKPKFVSYDILLKEIAMIHWTLVRKSRKNPDVCFYCERDIFAEPEHISDLRTLDHVIPRVIASKGGGIPHHNKVYCCHKCNSGKGNRLPSVWRKKVMALCKKHDNLHENHPHLRYWTTILKNLNILLNQEQKNNG